MMPDPYIEYKSGYKYQIISEHEVEIAIKPEEDIITDYIELYTNGKLIMKKGYAWDGPSGPTVDTHTFMRGSLVHDALYQLIRNNKLSQDAREDADRELRKICRKDGMTNLRASCVYWAVRWFGSSAAKGPKPIYKAPKQEHK